ncbi:MAG: CBS domain-containing protein, partial [Balneolaceae bacterium]
MLVNKSIITTDFKPLSGTSTVTEAKNRMEMTEANSLPVVDTETLKLIGQVSYGQIRDADENKTIAELDLEEPVRVFRGQHIFEIARVMFQYEIRSIPVVDDEDIFLGMITKQLVLESLSKMLNLAEFGSVITVALDPIDFTISEIVQIIE